MRPGRAVNSPEATLRLTPSSAWVSTSPMRKVHEYIDVTATEIEFDVPEPY